MALDDLAWLSVRAESHLHLLLDHDLDIGEGAAEEAAAPTARRLQKEVLSLLVTLRNQARRRGVSLPLPLCTSAVMQQVGMVASADSGYYDLALLASSLRYMLHATAEEAEWAGDPGDLLSLQAALVACVNTFGGVMHAEVPSFVQKGVCRLAIQCAGHVSASLCSMANPPVRATTLKCRLPSTAGVVHAKWVITLSEGTLTPLRGFVRSQDTPPFAGWTWEGSINWLPSLCSDRDETIRAAAFRCVVVMVTCDIC